MAILNARKMGANFKLAICALKVMLTPKNECIKMMVLYIFTIY